MIPSPRPERPQLLHVWRTLPVSKQSIPASVSFVSAESEQGTPVITSVPVQASPSVSLMRKFSPVSSTPTSQGVADQTTDTLAAEPSLPSDENPSQQMLSSASANIAVLDPAPALNSQLFQDNNPGLAAVTPPLPRGAKVSRSDSQLAPSRPSWFGSLSRMKKKQPAQNGRADSDQTAQLGSNYADSINAPISPVSTTQTQHPTTLQPFRDTEASPPQSHVMHSPRPSKRWFSSSASSPHTPASPNPLNPDRTPGSSSAGNEAVSKLPDVASPLTDPVPVEQSTGAGALPVNSSRFTLGIPLLGKPKVPLEPAVAAVQTGHAFENSNSVLDGVVKFDAENPGPVPHATADNGYESATISPPGKPLETHDPGSPPYSWWTYVGWGGSSPTQKPDFRFPELDLAMPLNNDVRANSTLAKPEVGFTPDAQIPLDIQPLAYPLGKQSNPDTSATSTLPQASAWYSPWRRYGVSSTASLPVTSDGLNTAVVINGPSKYHGPVATSGGDGTPQTALNPSESTLVLSEQLNPIQSTITANASGWSSFFSSKGLLVKSVTSDESRISENSMEVMHLYDEDLLSGRSIPIAGSSTASVKGEKTGIDAPNLRKGPKLPPADTLKTADSNIRRPTPIGVRLANEAPETKKRTSSSSSSKTSGANTPSRSLPNIVLPTWQDTFHAPPRSLPPPPSASTLTQVIRYVRGVLCREEAVHDTSEQRFREAYFGNALPKVWGVIGDKGSPDVLRGCTKVVVIGVHGWFPGPVMRTVIGEPTGTSLKFVNMMVQALEEFQESHRVKLQKITRIPLEGDGTIERRVEKLYENLVANQEWMEDLRLADAILVATHSQGSIVSTHLLDRLIREGHIRTLGNTAHLGSVSGVGVSRVPAEQPQRICCLALCGIHLGPLRYLKKNAVVLPYIHYFESTAARELFEFQNTENEVSKAYVKALCNVIDSKVKMVYIASLNDQVVPICSALFTPASHPLILRALYIDGDAYQSTDFLSKLLVLLLRVLNSGLSDRGLLAHLSEVTAGSLSGVGHSTAYEEVATYALAVKYLFMTNDGLEGHSELQLEPFDANIEQNDYEIPWSLRDLIADEHVTHFFSREIGELRDAFTKWQPKTSILRDVKRKLQPIERLPSTSTSLGNTSKL